MGLTKPKIVNGSGEDLTVELSEQDSLLVELAEVVAGKAGNSFPCVVTIPSGTVLGPNTSNVVTTPSPCIDTKYYGKTVRYVQGYKTMDLVHPDTGAVSWDNYAISKAVVNSDGTVSFTFSNSMGDSTTNWILGSDFYLVFLE